MTIRLKILVYSSILIGITLITLFFVKKVVYIILELEVSKVSFMLNKDVESFLSITSNQRCTFKTISVDQFSKAYYIQKKLSANTTNDGNLIDSISILPANDDVISQLMLTNANINNINIRRKTHLSMEAINKPSSLKLSFTDYHEQITILRANSKKAIHIESNDYKLSNGECPAGGCDLNSNRITLVPKDGVLNIWLHPDSVFSLEEDDVLSVTNLCLMTDVERDNSYSDSSNARSTILSGTLRIPVLEKEIKLAKRTKVLFSPSDNFYITGLQVSGKSIKLTIEGYTNNIQVGPFGNRHIPSVLEYLYKNNYLIMIFNSFMVVITFLLFLMKESSGASGKETVKG
jgi:hypothetical protein